LAATAFATAVAMSSAFSTRRCYCAGAPAERGQAANLKYLSVGSAGSASRRRTVAITAAGPCKEICPLSTARGKSIIAEQTLVKVPRSAVIVASTSRPGGRLEANLDVVGTQNEPPISRTAIGFRDSTEIETNDETLRRDFAWTDLAPYPPQEHFWVEVIRANQALRPLLTPHAHQLDDRSEIFAGPVRR
jgi:hypothetical protein